MQDESGRLWDVVWMLRMAIARNRGNNGSLIHYELHVVKSARDLGRTPPLVTLKAQCGPGDDGEPVITIMWPGEH